MEHLVFNNRIVQLVTSDNSFSQILKIGKNLIVHPKIFPNNSNRIQFSLIFNKDGEICLGSYNDLPLLIKSTSKFEKTYINNCLVFFSKLESIRIYPVISEDITFYFYFNVIEYEIVQEKEIPVSTGLKVVIENDNSNPLIEKSKQTDNEAEQKMLSKKREREEIQNECQKKEQDGFDEDNDCSICLESKYPSASLDNCKHDFCKKCIVNWSKSSSECPVCKSIFSKIIFSEGNSDLRQIRKIQVKPNHFKYEEEVDEEDRWIDNAADYCMVCKQTGDNYLMLVCDECKYNVCHTYCDGLDSIPEGDWYCKSCRSKMKAKAKDRSKKTNTKTTKPRKYNKSKHHNNRKKINRK